MAEELRTRLREELAQVGWRDLRQHAGRGALFLVRESPGVVEAALAVATDDRARVERWLLAGALARPSEAQLAAWEQQPDQPFECLIVQPFERI